MSHDREAAKAKEIETRKRLGRRTPKSPPAKPHVTAPPSTGKHKGTSYTGTDYSPDTGNR